jgi:hypothetical protein
MMRSLIAIAALVAYSGAWAEVEDYIAMSVVEANIDPFSTMNIGEWIGSAMSVKWPCDATVDEARE